MAIKDLFSKQKAQDLQLRGANKKSVDEFRQDIESGAEIKQIRIEDSLVIPDLNYASASNFVKYGSAKKYYEDAIKRIYSQYPYDGSNKEKVEFSNNLTQLERHILNVEYPKSTGFAVFSPNGWGTNTGPTFQGGFGKADTPEFIQFNSQVVNNVYDVSAGRQGNLHLNWTSGSTFEFWMKKDGFPNSSTQTRDEVIFQVSGSDGTGGHELELYIRRDTVNNMLQVNYFTYASGTPTVKFNTPITLNKITTFADSTWHHYALTMKQTSTTNVEMNVYVDGEFDQKINQTVSSMPTAMSGSLIGTIGAFGNIYVGNTGVLGYGKLSGSLDEFRFWKAERNAEQIGRNYFTVVNGGTNTDNDKYNDDNPVDLGVYFKFNEGKVGNSTIDSVVLDYSGRLSNGAWTGYVSNSRDTGSAIIQSSAGIEKGDPIIYSTHPDVVTLSTNLEASGTQHDAENVGSLQNSVPLWMLDENAEQGGELDNLLQVMGSYLDSLHLQISQISRFQEAEYQDHNNVSANPYNRRLLTSLGFDVPELFIDKNVLETIANQDDKRKFEDKLNEIKNLIYKNIYNNLNYINKSKGTVKSIRNLLRCYGVDDDLFNFNVYANNYEYVLQDDFKNSSVKFDSLDLTPFSNVQNSEGVIYNFSESGNTNSSPYISGSTNDFIGFTVEANTIFSKTPSTYQDSVNLTSPAIVTASVFGVREANFTNSTRIVGADAANISVRVIKDDNTAKFQLSSSLGVLLETDRFYDVYDNSRWSLSTRIKYNLDPFTDISGAPFKLEFNGYNYDQDILQNSFNLTASISSVNGQSFIASDKRVYAGAEKENITGSLIYRSNMKLLSVLAWADYLEDDELKVHARDVTSFGREEPYDNTFTFASGTIDNIFIPRFDTLAMNLAFNQVTSSDASGEFIVPDLSSGSVSLINKYGDYSKIVGIQNTAQGKGFAASVDVKDIQYLNISTQQIPENLNSDNMIQILESDDDLFFLENRPLKYFYSLEASMYDTISREMLKTFAGVLDYGSMVGSVLSEYQTNNKELQLARRNFFSRVENQPSLERYVGLYKFLDSAIESVLFNMMPASANSSDRIRTVVESHLFERPGHKKILIPGKSISSTGAGKKCTKLDSADCPPGELPACCKKLDLDCQAANPKLPICIEESNVDGIVSVRSNITLDRTNINTFMAPLNSETSDRIDQHLNRYTNKRFTGASDESGKSGWFAILAEREEAGLVAATTGDAKTRNSTFYSLKVDKLLDTGRTEIKGDYFPIALYGSQRANQGGNVILPLIQPELASDVLSLTKKDEVILDSELFKTFNNFDVTILSPTSERNNLDSTALPLRFTINGIGGFFGTSSLTGHALDTYYSNDFSAPLQGPFTEQHVGGYKHRHIQVGTTTDRPELFKIQASGSSIVRIFNPRTNRDGTSYDFNIPRVKFSREGLTKKPYNIKNIKTTTGSAHDVSTRLIMGNFQNNYEIVNLNGRKENNLAFVQQGGFQLTQSESTAVTGVLDFALPTRSLSDGTFNKSIIVNRFSSPGEVATMAEGFLDVDAAEFSPYNALPYRNRANVDSLNVFNRTPATLFGFESGSTTTGSFHQTPPNRVNIIKLNSAGNAITGSSFDNGFVTHQIPRKDFGYSWISASANPALSHDAVFGFATSSTGITFYSSSLRNFESSVDYVINFVGISTPGEFAQFAGYHYEISDNQNLLTTPLNYTTNPALADNIDVFFLNINGPYRYPTFKQSRTGNHPVARVLKRNNVILGGDSAGEVRISHSPITSKYKPILHNVKSTEIAGREPIDKDVLLKYTFANNYVKFGNYYDSSGSKIDNPFPDDNFNTANKQDSLLSAISNMYTQNRALELNSMLYIETIYPKETNAYLSKARDRSRFVFNWRDDISQRSAKLAGSQDDENFSLWMMDKTQTVTGELMAGTSGSQETTLKPRYGRYKLSGSAGFINLSSSSPNNTVQTAAGQGPFEDVYSEWNKDIRIIAKDHSIVPEYRISDNIEAIIESGFNFSSASHQALSLTGSISTDTNDVFLETFAHSDDIPAIEIVRETQQKDADRISVSVSAVKKLLPYDGFYPSQRTLQLSTLFSSSLAGGTTLAGSDASFQTLNNTIFSRLTYGSIRAGIATDTAIWTANELSEAGSGATVAATAEITFNNGADPEGFHLVLQNSEGFEVYRFDAVHSAGTGVEGDPFIINTGGSTTGTDLATDLRLTESTSGSIGITVNAYGAVVGLTASFDAGAAGNNNRILIQGDGSSVAGGAVATTGFSVPASFNTLSNMRELLFTGGSAGSAGIAKFNPTASFSRLPFETIIDPGAYLTDGIIENDPENFFDSTASVSYVKPAYSLAASNFYAGVVDTFIKSSTLTTIKTRPQSEWSFSDGSLKTYTMDVVVKKEANFSNHDDPAANGAPYTAHACFYQPLKLGTEEFYSKHINLGSSSVGASIPPAASWSENEAIATINFDYNAFKNVVTERGPTFNDILRFSTKTFKNKQIFEQLGSTEGTSTNTNSSQFMTVEAGVDLFNYDSDTEQWIVNTKCEFPVHNVAPNGTAVAAKFPNGNPSTRLGLFAGDVNRGVWHQFLTDTESKLKLTVRGPDTITNRTTGSLAQACGFETEQKVVSQIADSTELKEFLVVVPFVTNECQEEVFFHYPIDDFERAYAAIPTGQPQPTILANSAIQTRSTSLTDSLSRQRDLILPPTLNYMMKRDNAGKRLEQDEYGQILPPFAMYVFEVEQQLDQADLSKWWQGVLPTAGEKASFEKFNITHDIRDGEIISPSVLNNDLFGGKLPKEMRFKIFKAKYRRNLRYEEVKNKSLYGTEPMNSIFGYNYPHDFYSLIEMAKVDIGLEYDGKEDPEPKSGLALLASLDGAEQQTSEITPEQIAAALSANLLGEDE